MNHRRIIRRSLLATLTTLSLLPITVANAADADGTLLWGIRSSFNNYTHGPTKLTDVERENNAFKFKMDSYSYDAATNHTEAQFRGTIVYKKYCKDETKPLESHCDMDLTFQNPKIVIDNAGSYVEATVRSRQYQTGEYFAPEKPVKVATLETYAGQFSQANGKVSWSNIPTTLTEDGLKMFSNFYNVGEGLDNLSFEYTGEGGRLASDSRDLSITPVVWRSAGTYSDRHTLHPIGDDKVVVAQGGQEGGLFLLNKDLTEVARLSAKLSNRGTTAFDARTGYLYYGVVTNGDQYATKLERVQVTGDGFGTVEDIPTPAGRIAGVGVHPDTGTVIALVESGDGSTPLADRTPYLVRITGNEVTEQQIPSTAELFGKEIDPYSNTIYTTNYGNPTSLTNLAPMPDGTFVFSGGNHVSIQGDAYETKDVMLSIDPAQAAAEEAVKLMPGSIHGTNKYREGFAAHGDQIIRFATTSSKQNLTVEALRYANRDVTSVNTLSGSTMSGWAGVAWDKENRPVMLSGDDAKLIWFDFDTLEPIAGKEYSIPNGRETNNTLQGNFLALPDGQFYVPSLNESADDGNEYYELVHLFAPKNKQNPPAPSGDESKLKELQKTAATERLTRAKAEYAKAAQALIDAHTAGKQDKIKEAEAAVAKAASEYRDAQKTYNEVFGTNDPIDPDPVKTPEPKSTTSSSATASKSSEAAKTSASSTTSAATSEPTAKPQPQPGIFDGSQKNPLLTTVMAIIAVIGGIAATAFAFLPQLRQMFRF